jgi:hypothetical protein
VRRLNLAFVILFASGDLAAAPRQACFDIVGSRDNSRGTQSLFDARHCQGGGVTWGGIIRAVAKRRGVEESERFTIDDEADAVRICADDRKLVQALKADYTRLNKDAAELARTMNEASALDMECLEADGSAPKLPPLSQPPTLPPSRAADVRASLQRLQDAIARQPLWCLPPQGLEDRKGSLRFDGNGAATLLDGSKLTMGSWSLPRAGNGDDRIQVDVAGRLWHFNLGASGRLGFDAIGKTIARVELTPGACKR